MKKVTRINHCNAELDFLECFLEGLTDNLSTASSLKDSSASVPLVREGSRAQEEFDPGGHHRAPTTAGGHQEDGGWNKGHDGARPGDLTSERAASRRSQQAGSCDADYDAGRRSLHAGQNQQPHEGHPLVAAEALALRIKAAYCT